MTALLAKRARSKAQEVSVDFRPGLTVRDVIAAEGFAGPDADAITAVVNGETVAQNYELSEGATVELLVGIAGGAGKARLFRVIMPVPDVSRAAAFYAAVLDMPGQPVAGGSRHYFDCGGTILALANPGEHDNRSFSPNPDHVYFSVEDLEGALSRAKGVGCDWLGEIEVQPWGERSFYARDPFGNPICFVDGSTLFTGE